mgnify:FL=1
MKVIKNSNYEMVECFYKGKLVTLEKMFGTYIMTKGNKIYGQGFRKIPKTLEKLYNEMINTLKNN